VAREAAVKRLALVHCPREKQEAALSAAQALFPNAFWPTDGENVVVG
jgi:ribonuclease BN (tRNA processing enzyme)